MKTMFTTLSMFREGDNPIYGESVTEICIDDEAVGMFLVIRQNPDHETQELRFDLDEVDDLIKNIQYMKSMAKLHEESVKEGP